VNDRPYLTDNSICTTTTTTVKCAGAPVVGLTGERDMATAARAWAAVSDAICRRGGRQLVLDLTGVEFLGSHGLQVLTDTAAVTTQGGHELLRVTVGRSKRVLRPIQLAGPDAALALHENVEDVIVPVSGMSGRRCRTRSGRSKRRARSHLPPPAQRLAFPVTRPV
jgi:anti-sigma B factor antagonist